MSINPNDLIGMTLKQTYKIESVIGDGGMSVVYLAQQARPSRHVAIKVLLPLESIAVAYDVLLERFKREAQIIANFRHPNIMPIFDYDEHEGLPYLVMPCIRGGNLYTLLRNGLLPSHTTLTYIQQAASALDYAHRRNVVHRDIKPGNFLLDTDGQLILTDFGIARIMESRLTQAGEFLGTQLYAAPEVKLGERIDHRADIYSLGVVLCEMVTGYTPSELSPTQPTMPSAVDGVVRKATAEKPEDRYESAGALAEALQVAIANEHNAPTVVSRLANVHVLNKPLEDPPLAPAPRHATTPRSKLSRLISIGILLVTLLLIGGLVFTLQITGSFTLLFPPPTDTSALEQQASTTVSQYYNDWNKRDYQAAYNLLDPVYQKSNSLANLHYEQTHYSCFTIKSTTQLSDGTFQVAVTDDAIEDDPSGTGTVINVYTLDFIVKQEQGSWRLKPENLHRQPIQGFCQAP